ncbi:hypothetical protein [Streptomyces sp. MMG1121]|uniref:hypothetical protein n=1 Tax=Streptomyces sp. MMG1121 TaxID=1415544 RepID=UPI0006AEEDA4|nr:hypothetical protein [Streptomyces sp. MMG1121]KOV71032.1 hypothetical protein ADK64_01405 [Streptomyces sp. MMG1121]
MTEGNQGTGDERWDEFVREFEQSRGVHEPSATGHTERGAAAKRPRRRRLLAATAVAGAALAVAGAGFWLGAGHGTRHETADKAAGHAPAVPSGRPAATSAAPMPMVTADQAFPARVAGDTKVTQTGGPNCAGSVGPDLSALLGKSKGCRGVIGALYKDASGNQYTVVAFGMKDQLDVMRVMTALAPHPTDYEVPVLTPPAGSGLRALPADSGLVQSFAGRNKLLVIGLAQWSDGRSADYQALVHKLQPLLDKVTEAAGGHDGRG